ncbi:MAG TPA: hypothetical protein VGO40_15230 [Longimicrobium sp.]|jgi:hypothetical protein|nr:hypothetical protein [Longimicrobium sp.]
MSKRILPAAACAALFCAAPARALSQQFDRTQAHAPRGWFEYFATGASRSLVGDGGGGVGARLLLRVPSSAPVLERIAVGGYAARLPGGPGSARAEFGVHTEWSAVGRGALDPVVTLGLGAVQREGGWRWHLGDRLVRLPTPGTSTALTVAPGVGARMHVRRGVALRGDLRRAFPLGRNGVGGTEVAGGISLAL